MKQHFGFEDKWSDAPGRLVEGTCGQGLGGDGRGEGTRPDLRGLSLAHAPRPQGCFELFPHPDAAQMNHRFQTLRLQSFV